MDQTSHQLSWTESDEDLLDRFRRAFGREPTVDERNSILMRTYNSDARKELPSDDETP